MLSFISFGRVRQRIVCTSVIEFGFAMSLKLEEAFHSVHPALCVTVSFCTSAWGITTLELFPGGFSILPEYGRGGC